VSATMAVRSSILRMNSKLGRVPSWSHTLFKGLHTHLRPATHTHTHTLF
jgi:hypothetical protein